MIRLYSLPFMALIFNIVLEVMSIFLLTNLHRNQYPILPDHDYSFRVNEVDLAMDLGQQQTRGLRKPCS